MVRTLPVKGAVNLPNASFLVPTHTGALLAFFHTLKKDSTWPIKLVSILPFKMTVDEIHYSLWAVVPLVHDHLEGLLRRKM